MKTKTISYPKLYKIAIQSGPKRGESAMYWLFGSKVKEYKKFGYGVEEIATCSELSESMTTMSDKTQGVIGYNDVLDAMIDLYLFGGCRDVE